MPEKKQRTYKIIFWSIIFLSGQLFYSCANEDCLSIFNNHLLVGFIQADTLENGDIVFDEADTLFYSVRAIGNDSTFYDADTIVSTLTLPVNPAANQTRFELTMLDSIGRDSLNNPIYYINPVPHIIDVSYTRGQRIITEDCGVEIGYGNVNLDEITFPTTILVEDRLSRLNEVNVEVYF